MIKVATINADDMRDGAVITVGCELIAGGYRVVADNGDDVGYYEPQPFAKCVDDIYAMWAAWDTFCMVNTNKTIGR